MRSRARKSEFEALASAPREHKRSFPFELRPLVFGRVTSGRPSLWIECECEVRFRLGLAALRGQRGPVS